MTPLLLPRRSITADVPPPDARRLRVLARALRRTGDHEAAVACFEESESILRDLGECSGTEAERHASDLAETLSGLAVTLRTAALAHLDAGRPAAAVTALRSLLGLTRRTAGPDVHALCGRAFAEGRARHPDDVVRAWEQATGEPFPTFVHRIPAGQHVTP